MVNCRSTFASDLATHAYVSNSSVVKYAMRPDDEQVVSSIPQQLFFLSLGHSPFAEDKADVLAFIPNNVQIVNCLRSTGERIPSYFNTNYIDGRWFTS
jgi:hypothetical protein